MKTSPSSSRRTKAASALKAAEAILKTLTTPRATQSTPSDDADGLEARIRSRAYELYAQSDYKEGHAEEHWLQAENEIAALQG